MRARYIHLAIALSVLLGASARATTCYDWLWQNTTHHYATGSEFCAAAFAFAQSNYSGNGGIEQTGCSVTGAPTELGQTATMSYHSWSYEYPGPVTYNSYGTYSADSVEITCPTNPCTSKAGQDSGFQIGPGRPPSSFCKGGCQYTVGGISAYVEAWDQGGYSGVATGEQCSTNTANLVDGQCMTKAGLVACKVTDGSQSCMTFNGDKVCENTVSNGCVKYESGAVSCVATGSSGGHPVTATPPGPDNGTAGQPATPTAEVSKDGGVGNGGSTTNYYNSSTVNGSSSGATTSGSGSSTGSTTGGSGTGTGDTGSCSGDDCHPGESAGGGGSCDAAPSCSGDPISCAQLQQEWLQRCPGAVSSSDLAGAIGTVDSVHNGTDVDASNGGSGFASDRFGSSSGGCPSALTLNFMGRSISYDPYEKVCEFGSIFKAIALVFAYLAAARIALSGSS